MSSESNLYADRFVVVNDSHQRHSFDWAGSLGRWMIFCAGLAVLVAVLILPAQVDLRQSRVQRDLALHIEHTQRDRIERYEDFFAQLEAPDETTINLLAMSQLGVIPDDRDALIVPGRLADPQLFEFLEPAPKPFIPRSTPVSELEELATGSRSRLWVALLGAVAVLYGLLPSAKV
jgi:hypothetical protein